MLQDWISSIEGWVPALAESLWVFPALYVFATVDGFFPPVPSESVVIGLSSLSVSQGHPNLALVLLVAALGAFTGDQIAYAIGSRVDVHRLAFFRTERGRRTLAWAEHALAHRGSSFILAARYIPVGRVAVNMTAGALGYPRKRFVGLTALAAVTWAGYGTLVGAGAGVWLEGQHPMVAVVGGVVFGTAVGIGIDWVLRRWTGLDRAPASAQTPEREDATRPGTVPEDADDAAGDPAATRPVVTAVTAGTPACAAAGTAPCGPGTARVTSRQRSGPVR